jgi:hypothetical protein
MRPATPRLRQMMPVGRTFEIRPRLRRPSRENTTTWDRLILPRRSFGSATGWGGRAETFRPPRGRMRSQNIAFFTTASLPGSIRTTSCRRCRGICYLPR